MILPHYREIIDFVRSKTRAKIFHHCCGSVIKVVDLLLEAGIDILNPLQPRARDMDSTYLKDKYGKRIIFHGLYDRYDRHFILEMLENTCREILVGKFFHKNPFLVGRSAFAGRVRLRLFAKTLYLFKAEIRLFGHEREIQANDSVGLPAEFRDQLGHDGCHRFRREIAERARPRALGNGNHHAFVDRADFFGEVVGRQSLDLGSFAMARVQCPFEYADYVVGQ